MDYFIWQDSYNLGIKEIDEQHKKWFEIMNRLFTAFQNKTHNEEMAEILQELIDYTKYHFQTEEKTFVEKKYEKLEEHRKLHQDFVKQLNELNAEYKSGKTAITYKLMNFMRKWLVDHIQDEDRKYISLYKKGQIA